MAQLDEHRPVYQKGYSSIPSQGVYPYQLDPW